MSFEQRRDFLFRMREAAGDDGRLFAIVDAALVPMFPVYAEGFGDDVLCLFDGAALEQHEAEAPYIVVVELNSRMAEFLLTDVVEAGACVFLLSSRPARRLKTHLKKFIKVRGPDRAEFFFKFYLPQVFATHYPAFNPEQRKAFFAELDMLVCFMPDAPVALRFEVGNAKAEALEPANA